jgi:Tol biopolymer transport system component
MTQDGESVEQVTDDPSHEMGSDFLANGKQISFSSDRSGIYELYIVTQDKSGWSEPEQITFEGCASARSSYVRDCIAYIAGDGLRIVYPKDRKEKILVKIQNEMNSPRPQFPAWAVDGKTLYYSAVDEKGVESIWAVPVIGGEPELKVVSDDPHFRLALMGLSTNARRFYFPIRLIESNIWASDLLFRE